MRCMTAIWPAGPPKLRSAILSQTRNASRSDTPCRGAVLRISTVESSATSGLARACGRPVVRLRLETATPAVERVVDHHAVHQHLVIIGKVGGEAERDGEQAAALRGQIVPGGIGAAHDRREVVERRIGDPVDAQEGIERAAIAFMGELDAGDVVGRGAGLLGGRQDAIRRYVDEGCGRIDETPDQPGAGDAVDLRPLPGHPLRWSLPLSRALAPERKILRVPGAEAAGEI